jgi:hypothetical protein
MVMDNISNLLIAAGLVCIAGGLMGIVARLAFRRPSSRPFELPEGEDETV